MCYIMVEYDMTALKRWSQDGHRAGDYIACRICVEWQTEDTQRDIICTSAAADWLYKLSDSHSRCHITSVLQKMVLRHQRNTFRSKK